MTSTEKGEGVKKWSKFADQQYRAYSGTGYSGNPATVTVLSIPKPSITVLQ